LCFEEWGFCFPDAPFLFQNGFFYFSGTYFSTVFPVSGVKPVIFGRFGQYDSSPGYWGHAMGVVLLLFGPTEAIIVG
jgi:hypothetical protein